MKKIIAFAVMLATVLSVAGCGGTQPAAPQSSAAPEPPPASSAPASQPTPEPEQEPEPEPENLAPITDEQRKLLDEICAEVDIGNYERAWDLMSTQELLDILQLFQLEGIEGASDDAKCGLHYKDIFQFIYYDYGWGTNIMLYRNNVRNGNGIFEQIIINPDYDVHLWITYEHKNGEANGKYIMRDNSGYTFEAQLVNGAVHGEIVQWDQDNEYVTYTYIDGILQATGPEDANGIPCGIRQSDGATVYEPADQPSFHEPWTFGNPSREFEERKEWIPSYN